MSIRSRMALGVTVLIGVVLVLASVLTYQLLAASLLADIRRDVDARARAYGVMATTGDLDVFSAPDVFLQILGSDGRPTRSSGNLGGRVLPVPAAAWQGQVVDVQLAGRPLLLTTAALRGGGGRIVVARSPVTVYGALSRLRELLVIVDAAALVVAGVLGWLFAHVTLRPVARMTAAADQVRAGGDLSRGVTHRGPADEIGRLAVTFNGMLAELDTTHRRLDESNQRLRRFLADCAHELRTPLTLVMSNLDLIAKIGDSDPEFRVRALADVHDEADRMARMITQLLILARADSGLGMPAEPVDVGQVVLDACQHGQRMRGDATFLGDHPALAGVTVCGNADYLRQALLILLDNAAKYTPPSGDVRVESVIEDGHVLISVVDTGIGITPHDLPHIFDRFYRGTTTNGATGTGLGLAIATWITEQHGGTLAVQSSPGAGSRFTLRLPLVPRATSG